MLAELPGRTLHTGCARHIGSERTDLAWVAAQLAFDIVVPTDLARLTGFQSRHMSVSPWRARHLLRALRVGEVAYAGVRAARGTSRGHETAVGTRLA